MKGPSLKAMSMLVRNMMQRSNRNRSHASSAASGCAQRPAVSSVGIVAACFP